MYSTKEGIFRDKDHYDLYRMLQSEAKNRDQYADPNEWIINERLTMWNYVNHRRAELNKKSISLDEVLRVENTAVGHIDYARKFSLYCSELIHV